ncbi:MAG: DUF2332 domain-containing protein [Rhizobiaceae bacterium]|nr:DUF2332 domain-containing protein [Rhizobiaceae bacterium]
MFLSGIKGSSGKWGFKLNNIEVATHFQKQAKACRNMGSPFTARLCEQLPKILGNDTKTAKRIENWPGDPAADALALRLCGALHSIVISNPQDDLATIYPDGEHPDYSTILTSAIRTHDDTLCRWLDLPPQTNETGRAAALLPGLLEIARRSKLPVHLCEIGASAGLNMQLDSFFYTYESRTWGSSNSSVKLAPEMRGALPDLTGDLNITSRVGCDLSPLDILDPKEQLRLRSYVWPDQQFRAGRLDGAIKLAIATPPELVKMDAAQFVEQQLLYRPNDTAFVLMHSVVWQYLPAETKAAIENSMQKHGNNATSANPVYWLRLEGFGGVEPGASLLLDSWPDHSQIKLANACFHGSWINFL